MGMTSILEGVQRRATKMVVGCRGLSYPDRLRKLGLPTLAYRSVRASLIFLCKDIKNGGLLSKKVFPLSTSTTRGHSLKLEKKRVHTRVARSFISSRIFSWWNSLPESVISSTSLNSFKNSLNNHFNGLPLKFDWRDTSLSLDLSH